MAPPTYGCGTIAGRGALFLLRMSHNNTPLQQPPSAEIVNGGSLTCLWRRTNSHPTDPGSI